MKYEEFQEFIKRGEFTHCDRVSLVGREKGTFYNATFYIELPDTVVFEFSNDTWTASFSLLSEESDNQLSTRFGKYYFY